jgi:hypothetical protein
MKVLVAGDRRYIAAALVPVRGTAGRQAGRLDPGLYERCDFGHDAGDIDEADQ